MKQIFVRILVVLTITVLGTNSKSGDCECGVRGDGRQRCRRSGRVAGGDEAAVGQFPWMALLVIRKTGEKTRRCGGSLINDRFVLTSAHCVQNADGIDINLGDHDLTRTLETNAFKVKAERPFIIHERYTRSKNSVSFNFALLKLSETVDYNRYPNIRPICLPDGSYKNYDGEGVVVAGWGDTRVTYSSRGSLVKGRSSSPANKLQKISLRLVNQNTCRDIFQKLSRTSFQIQEDNLCASSVSGDFCTGDAGGGLVLPVCPGGYDELVGVASFGNGCNSTYQGEKIPGGYGRVSSISDWIKTKTSNGQSCNKPSLIPKSTPQPLVQNCKCGKMSSIGIGVRITGGKEAEENEFPWAVLLKISKNGRNTMRCGGSLINDRYVLSAGHCLPKSNLDVEVTLGI